MTNRIHAFVLFTMLASTPALGDLTGATPVDCQVAFSFLEDADAANPRRETPPEIAPANNWPTPPEATPKQLTALERL